MPEITTKRCAIYTRKSVEDEVAKEFNSNDAQREAGEAYIASQRGNGWVVMPERYDDHGYSGGNVNRPALQKLLNDAESGLIDIIVVYKIDRLSRSITDFAELSKNFDKWGVSFVAVTQDINTSTSSGRMMLNILMTFAQYEREVIAERVRDKMSATRKKGKWVGGTVPFGYQAVDKKLQINPQEAEIIKSIFQRYIEIQSPKQIAMELNQRGIRNRNGSLWNHQHLNWMLNNKTYIGQVEYKGEIYDGEHEGIITTAVWTRVQEIMENNRPVKEPKGRAETLAPLKGILRCGHCNGAMIPTYGIRRGHKYFYYLCSKDNKRAESICPVHRIPAADIEELICNHLAPIIQSPPFVAQTAKIAAVAPNKAFEMLNEEFFANLTNGERNRLFTLLLEQVVIHDDHLEIELKTAGVKSLIEEIDNAENRSPE